MPRPCLFGHSLSCRCTEALQCWLQHAGKSGYMAIGLGASLPCVILPWLLEHRADRNKPWQHKYWVKANVWIAIFSFIGNYFWTHYFYTVLGAEYTFPSWRFNEVFPHCSSNSLSLSNHQEAHAMLRCDDHRQPSTALCPHAFCSSLEVMQCLTYSCRSHFTTCPMPTSVSTTLSPTWC